MEVPITDVDGLFDYAEDVWEKNVGHSRKDFDANANTRSKEKFINDRVFGKCGEMALCSFIENICGYSATPNLTVYESGGKEEYADIESVNGEQPKYPFDVKTTKPWNKWLTVREAIYKTHTQTDPIVLALVDPDQIKNRESIIMVDLVGWVQVKDLSHYFERGNRLTRPGTETQIGPPLKTNNYAYPINEIERLDEGEWKEFVATYIYSE